MNVQRPAHLPTIDKYGRRFVAGVGSLRSPFMGVGEAPGKQEDKYGRPWIGKAGKELRRYVRQAADLDIRDFYLSNLVKYRPLTNKASGNSAPTMADIERDEGVLIEEIRQGRPKWIFAIGRIAARWFFEDPELEMDECAGHAYPGLRRAGGAIVIPVYHPAAGIHQADLQPHVYKSFRRAGKIVRGELPAKPPTDDFPDPDYYHVKGGLSSSLHNAKIAFDTEGTKGNVWSVQYSFIPGSAGIVLAKNQKAVEYIRDMVLYNNNTIGLHNAPWDLQRLAEFLGVPLVDLLYRIKFDDTMQMAYNLCLYPKGLKALCQQLKGMPMKSYWSVVEEADRDIMVEWFKQVLKYRCQTCNGAGETLEEPVSQKTGKKLAARLVRCGDCAGDGTAWEPPEEQLVYRKGKMSISSGHRMGKRIRKILEAKDKRDEETGRLTNLRKRWTELKKKSYNFGIQVEDKLGVPREVTLGDVPFSVAKEYACKDADGTKRIWPDLEKEIEQDGLRKVYEIDRGVIPMITMMQHVGWKIDVPFLTKYSNQLQIQIDKLQHQLDDLVGYPINVNSPQQMGELLFKKWGLHPVKLTDTGNDSTDNKVLSDLQILANSKMESEPKYRKVFDGITLSLGVKERGKIKSTYTQKLPRMVDQLCRLHTQIKQASVNSGRLASADPNLQNIPARTDLGKAVRKAFICEEGNVLIAADYSQIEMRLLAHESNEKQLIKAIKGGLDVHNLTTSKIFGIPYEKVAKNMWQRDAAKTLVFGIVYGISAPALKTQIKLQSAKHTVGGVDVPIEKCEGWIEDYTHRTYPAIGDYMADSQAEARRDGYVADWCGRRRYLPGVHSDINSVRSEAERIATNHKIQGGAQEIIKLAMSEIWLDVLPKFRKRGFCECIMQIHDELVFEVKESLAEELKKEVEKVMSGVVRLKVPLAVSGEIGLRWAELKG